MRPITAAAWSFAKPPRNAIISRISSPTITPAEQHGHPVHLSIWHPQTGQQERRPVETRGTAECSAAAAISSSNSGVLSDERPDLAFSETAVTGAAVASDPIFGSSSNRGGW